MPNDELTNKLDNRSLDAQFRLLYGADSDTITFQKKRYLKSILIFKSLFGDGGKLHLLSVPGRSEVGGNHTDHNHGRVLACAINLDIIAVARINDSGIVTIKSEGYNPDSVDLNSLDPVANERSHSRSLVRGVCARLKAQGYKIGGFDACTTSSVLKGSGLSSSAAFEVMVALMINTLYNNGAIDPVTMAKASQFAEREYFGKPCGLMDQTACAFGGFITIDFADTNKPVIEKLDFDFKKTCHTLCIVDTAGDHSDLTDDYAAIQSEMKAAAKVLGKNFLRDCDERAFYKDLNQIRAAAGDRAVLRAIHFFGDNTRVTEQTAALKTGDFELFKKLVIESGRSSSMYLQNSYSVKSPMNQGVTLALAMAERLLAGRGAWRIHGGGFAGTIQAFVPNEILEEFVSVMNGLFGKDACYCLSVRPVGAYELDCNN